MQDIKFAPIIVKTREASHTSNVRLIKRGDKFTKITFPAHVVEKLGWEDGDRVTMGQHANFWYLVERVAKNGEVVKGSTEGWYTLRALNGGKTKALSINSTALCLAMLPSTNGTEFEPEINAGTLMLTPTGKEDK